MTHPELDDLLDLVRGDAPGDVRRHVDACAHCTTELGAMARLDAAEDALTDVRGPRPLDVPDPAVWDRIQAELHLSVAPAAPVVLAQPVSAGRPRRRLLLVAAAAVCGIALGGIAGYLLGDDGPGDRSTDGMRPLVAAGTLSPVGPATVTGQLALTREAAGHSLSVTLSQPVAGPGYVEAWLLDPLTDEMLGLGVLGPAGGTVTVPADADLTRFTTVDISREPYDGDPAHSVESLARGVLRG